MKPPDYGQPPATVSPRRNVPGPSCPANTPSSRTRFISAKARKQKLAGVAAIGLHGVGDGARAVAADVLAGKRGRAPTGLNHGGQLGYAVDNMPLHWK